MATLNVTNLQNVASTVTNVSLLADGTTSLVLNATGTARTGGIRYNAGNLELYTGTAWVAAGGGGGTVTGVTASLPLVSSGGAAPNLTINAATTALPGSVQLADATASQAGTSATLVNTPAFSVPKDAATMTGAAILPSGTTGQQPTTLVAGMTRFNTTTGDLEFYTGSAWNGATAKVLGAGAGATYDEGASILPSGTTAQRPGTPAVGMTRVSTDSQTLETYANGAWQTVQSTSSGSFAGFRNQIINGNMEVWQRGTSFTSGFSSYTADRWLAGTTTTSVNQGIGGLAGFSYNLVFAGPIAAAITQPVELAEVGQMGQFSPGSQWTMSFYSDSPDLTVSLGFADSAITFSAGEQIVSGGAVVSLGGSRYSHTFTIPAGQTIAATRTCFLARLNKTSAATVTITGVQLEPGPVATPFEQRPIQVELAMCQRYYNEAAVRGMLANVSNSAGASCQAWIPLPVPMRATPTTSSTTVRMLRWFGSATANPTITSVTAGQSGVSLLFTAIDTVGTQDVRIISGFDGSITTPLKLDAEL